MRYCCKTLHARWLRQTEAPMAECAALPVESGEAVERQWRAWSRERERERDRKSVERECRWRERRWRRVGSCSYLLSRWR
jgi:hypothetical protein